MKLYLAGKITGGGWRNSIVSGLAQVCEPAPPYPWPVLPKSIFGIHDYTGPYFMSDHDRMSHYDDISHEFDVSGGHDASDEQWTIHHSCITGIDAADAVFAWIDQDELHGTLVEIGYARGFGKPIFITGPTRIPALWFAYQTGFPRFFGFANARHALRHILLQEELPLDMYAQNRTGYVYILRAGPYYKIGRARSIDTRVKQIALQLPFPIELLHTIESPDYIAAEHALHNLFAADRTNGEWFRLHDDDVAWLLTLKHIRPEEPE